MFFNNEVKSTRSILIAMILLQMLWLMIIWITGVGTNMYKIIPLLIYTFIVGAIILLMSNRIMEIFNSPKEYFLRHEKWLVLLLCLISFVINLIYAKYQKVWFDEKYLYHASQIVAEYGVSHFFSVYKEIPWLGAQHPPLIPLFYGFFIRLLGGNLFTIRIISALLGTTTDLVTYFLGRLYCNRETGFLAAFFFNIFSDVLPTGVNCHAGCAFAVFLFYSHAACSFSQL